MISAAEYLELIALSGANISQNAVAATSVLFAYIAAAYFVGKQLSRFQVIAISLLYSVYFTFPVLATVGEQRRVQVLTGRFEEEFPAEFLHYYGQGHAQEYLMYGGLVISFLAWALSIYFMVDRRKKPEP